MLYDLYLRRSLDEEDDNLFKMEANDNNEIENSVIIIFRVEKQKKNCP